MQDCAARSFVNAAALHSNETVLHNIDATDAVFSAEPVKRLHNVEWRHGGTTSVLSEIFGPDGAGPSNRNVHTVAGFEHKIDIFRFVRRVFRRDTELVHVSHFF